APTWVLFVHGTGASPVGALRVLPVVDALGMCAMRITYRNDAQALPGPSGRYGYGTTQWRDRGSAIAFARAGGAGQVVLCGFSMGAGIIFRWLRERGSEGIAGIVLDSPMLSFGAAVEHQARAMRVPPLMVEAGKLVAGLRF